ncbi:MAG: hypothetical protein RIT27_1641 [Pseudomonadota bacterium]|jgi:hypothetical protein
MKKWFVVLICSVWILPAFAEKAYKWIDEEGSVQISQTPPPAGAKEIKQIDLPKALLPNTFVASQPKQPAPEKKEEKTSPSNKTPEVDVTKMTPQQIHELNCTNAKRHLDLLKTNEKVVIPDEKDSTKLHLASAEQRDAEIKKAEESVDKFCNAPPPVVQQNPNDKKPEENTDKKTEKK